MRSEILMGGLESLSIRDLRAIVALAERLHFGRAAEDLSIAQPSLSAAVKKVEEAVGERLFDRTSRHVALTPAGQRVVQHMRSVLAELSELGRSPEPGERLGGRFRLGLVPTIGPYYAPRFLSVLRARYPRLELVLTEALTEILLTRLRQGTLDAAVVCLPTGEHGLTETPLLRERFLLALPSSHPLAGAPEVSLGQIDPREMVLMERGHCLREQTLETCGITPESAAAPAQAASVETLRHLVASGSGCALFPEMAVAPGLDCGGLVRYLPFRDPAPGRTIGLVFPGHGARREDAEELARFLEGINPA